MKVDETRKRVRQIRFAQAKIEGKSHADAAIEAGLVGKNAKRKSAREAGCRTAQDSNVRATIDALLEQSVDEAKLTADLIVQMLLREAVNATEGGTRVRALELLGKTKAMFADRSVTEVRESTTDDKLLERLRRINPALADVFGSTMTKTQ